MGNTLLKCTPEEVGISSEAVHGFLDQIERNQVHLHSFMILRGKKVFAQGAYAPCRMEDIHMLFSLSKSFTSTAVGFAVQEGRLSLSDRLVDFFEEELAGLPEDAVCDRMKKGDGAASPYHEYRADRPGGWIVFGQAKGLGGELSHQPGGERAGKLVYV